MQLKEKAYDDSEEIVWKEVYAKTYSGKKIGKHFDVNKAKLSKDRNRIVAKSFCDDLEIGGETDFNFSDKIGIHRKSKYRIFYDILTTINNEDEKMKAINLLEICKKKTYGIENFSLMLCNGSMQSLKGTLDKDRIDLFIYLIDNYYKEMDEIILSHCVPCYEEKLKRYLDLFRDDVNLDESIFNYCEEIYHISNKVLVEKLIQSGKKTINTPERVIEYMKLALEFWDCKYSYYHSVGIMDE